MQNPQACSSLLTDTSSAVNGCTDTRRPGLMTNCVKRANNCADFSNSTAPRPVVIQNRDIEVLVIIAYNYAASIVVYEICERFLWNSRPYL